MYNIKKVLEITRNEKAKKQTADSKRSCGRPRKRLIKKIEEEDKDEAIAISSSGSDIELKESVSRRTRSRKAD